MDYDPLDRDADPFKPPEVPTEIGCLHCGQVFDSSLIEWRVETDVDGRPHGFWCCPMPGCSGMGFGFDLLPTDPTYRDEHGGWVMGDAEDEEFTDDELAMAEEEELRELDAGEQEGWGLRNGRHGMRNEDMPF